MKPTILQRLYYWLRGERERPDGDWKWTDEGGAIFKMSDRQIAKKMAQRERQSMGLEPMTYPAGWEEDQEKRRKQAKDMSLEEACDEVERLAPKVMDMFKGMMK